jgi:primosomal protein N'
MNEYNTAPYPEHEDYEHLSKCHRCGAKYPNDKECPNCKGVWF